MLARSIPSFRSWWKKHSKPSSRSNPSRWGNRYRLLCEILEDRVVPDAGPRVTAVTPLEVRNATFDHFDVTFSRAIDASTLTASDVIVQGATSPVTVTGVTMVAADRARVDF